MSKEVKRYEVTILLDASSSYTVEADSVEAAEHAAWEAHDEAGPSLCHQCSGAMDLGDAYGMLIYCEGKEVADTTHGAREIADLRAERDALLAERDALKKDAERESAAFNAVITYILGKGSMESPMEFLRCWNEGDFESLREEWPEAPQEIYYADPFAEYDAIDAALQGEQ